MADITVPRLRDFFALSGQQESISNETHVIPFLTPYVVDLDQLPKVRSSASNILENVWLSVADATGIITVEIETSPSTWQVATITESASPGSLEVHFQISKPLVTPYSPRMVFNSANKGQNVRVSYTGMGTVPLARYFQQLFEVIVIAKLAGAVNIVDMQTYNNGLYDDQGEATTEVWAAPSNIAIIGTGGDYGVFPGLTLDFGAGGNVEVAAFSNANYWKRVVVNIDFTAPSTWTLYTQESSEAASQGALSLPSIDFQYTTIGYVDVQNDGTTGVAGSILDITDTNTQSMYSLPQVEYTLVTTVGDPGSDSDVPSEQGVREALDLKIDTSDRVTTVGDPGTDTSVVSEQGIREEFDNHIAWSDSVTTVGDPGSNSKVATEQAIREALDALGPPDYILIQDQKTQDTDGGSFNSGARRVRDLNTIVSDAGGHASITKVTFTSGSDEPAVGDEVEGQTSAATGDVFDVVLDSGTWGGGDADGEFWLVNVSGTFQAETLDNNTQVQTNIATCDGAQTQHKIRLKTGTYRYHISCPALYVDSHQAWLRNVSDSSDIGRGTTAFASSSYQIQTRSFVMGRFTLAANKTLEVLHQCETSRATYGFGMAANFGTEVYTTVEIWKE